MAQLASEQRERRALMRARRAAVAAEEEDRRLEERRQQWHREGTYLGRAEMEGARRAGGAVSLCWTAAATGPG